MQNLNKKLLFVFLLFSNQAFSKFKFRIKKSTFKNPKVALGVAGVFTAGAILKTFYDHNRIAGLQKDQAQVRARLLRQKKQEISKLEAQIEELKKTTPSTEYFKSPEDQRKIADLQSQLALLRQEHENLNEQLLLFEGDRKIMHEELEKKELELAEKKQESEDQLEHFQRVRRELMNAYDNQIANLRKELIDNSSSNQKKIQGLLEQLEDQRNIVLILELEKKDFNEKLVQLNQENAEKTDQAIKELKNELEEAKQEYDHNLGCYNGLIEELNRDKKQLKGLVEKLEKEKEYTAFSYQVNNTIVESAFEGEKEAKKKIKALEEQLKKLSESEQLKRGDLSLENEGLQGKILNLENKLKTAQQELDQAQKKPITSSLATQTEQDGCVTTGAQTDLQGRRDSECQTEKQIKRARKISICEVLSDSEDCLIGKVEGQDKCANSFSPESNICRSGSMQTVISAAPVSTEVNHGRQVGTTESSKANSRGRKRKTTTAAKQKPEGASGLPSRLGTRVQSISGY